MRRLFATGRQRAATLQPPELKNPERELSYFRRRLLIAGVVMIVAFSGLFGRFIYLQVFLHRHYQTLAESNRIAIVPIAPNRGVITDRNGVVLAQSYSAYTLEVTPSRVKNLDAMIDDLSRVIDVQPRDRKRFKRLLEDSKNFESLPLRTRLSDEEVARFAVNRYRFPGVEIKARLFRQYPFGETASHLIGYIGRINDRDVKRIEEWGDTANYKGSDYIGKVGVEISYERELHGTTGVEEVEVDAGGRAVRTLSRTPPTSGNNLRLALDIKLQQVAERAFGDRRGALVALDPASGEVLAFVSKPGFDPNLFVDGIDPASWDLLNESPDKPMLNRPLRGAYPPGSTIKPFLALGALASGKRSATQSISDPGYYQIAGSAHRFRDDKPGGHGSVDMYKSIVVSCDTYYYMLAADTDIDDTHAFMSQFGFGRDTGIDIDGELPGVLPSREWKRERFAGKNFRDEHRKWYLGDSISAGIGQGYNAFTPLQQAQAIAVIANDGNGFRPHVVKSVENVATGEVRPIPPEVTHTLNVKADQLAVIKAALAGVPKEGTSAQAFVGTKYVSSGKTGTAQLYSLKGEKYVAGHVDERLRDHAWYIAYAPADHPKIAVAVLVENGGFGAQAAAPIARAVFDYYLLGEQAPPVTSIPGPRDADDESDYTMADVFAFLARAWELLARRVDSYLLSAALAIAGIGLVTLFSASDQSVARVTSQAASLGFALVLMWIVANISPQQLARAAVPLYVLSVLLLCAVAVSGTVVNGSRRWLNLGIGRFQPSELMKIALPLMLAWYFQRHEARIGVRDFLLAAVLIAVPVWLIKRQPDLGTALMIGASGFYVLFLAGLTWKIIVGLAAGGAAAAPLIWPHLREYQKERVLTFIDPSRDPLGAGYHSTQASIALGSGGAVGKGWLNGTQTHLDFLPERHTDFIFAVFGEEFGLIGNLVLLILYILLIGRALVITMNASTLFARLVSGAITLMFFTYAFVNMAMVSGLLPIVGVPLPLVSFGGTALVSLFIGLGILMSVQANRKLVKT